MADDNHVAEDWTDENGPWFFVWDKAKGRPKRYFDGRDPVRLRVTKIEDLVPDGNPDQAFTPKGLFATVVRQGQGGGDAVVDLAESVSLGQAILRLHITDAPELHLQPFYADDDGYFVGREKPTPPENRLSREEWEKRLRAE